MEHAIIEVQQALASDFDLRGCDSKGTLIRRLSMLINELIEKDFNRLVAILYRLDINEWKLGQTLKANHDSDAGDLIAELIVERQLQKQASRKLYRGDEDIPEDEKW